MPQLRSRAEPEGIQPVPTRWRRYVAKHNALASFTAELAEAAHARRARLEWSRTRPTAATRTARR
eukprot:2675-Pleurochrysis_carterae.AAC.1